MEKTADRIVSLLVDFHPTPLTDKEIASHLNLPAPSVRRTRSKIEDSGMVWYAGMREGRTVFTAADYLVEAREVQRAAAEGVL